MAWSNVTDRKSEEKKMVGSKIEEMHPATKNAGGVGKDVKSGMELLELDFLLSIVENTKGNDPNDVTMRRLNFNELLRRGKQDQISSSVLAVYTVNAGDLYGKTIQCEATKELTKRTAK